MRDFVYFDNYLNNVLTRLNKRQISCRTRQNAESQKTRSHTHTHTPFYAEIQISNTKKVTHLVRVLFKMPTNLTEEDTEFDC